MGERIRQCNFCGANFSYESRPGMPPAQCSDKCKAEAKKRQARDNYYKNRKKIAKRLKEKRAADATYLDCVICGKPFRKVIGTQLCCSNDCSAVRKRERENARKREKYNTHNRTCKVCGARFYPRGPQKYCSKLCRGKFATAEKARKRSEPEARAKYLEYMRAYNAKYRAENKEQLAASKSEYQKRNRDKINAYRREWFKRDDWRKRDTRFVERYRQHMSYTGEDVKPSVVYERHDGICAICGDKIPLSLDNPRHPLYLNIDHIVPLSKGGTHCYENVQPTHAICNMRKGAKFEGVSLVT